MSWCNRICACLVVTVLTGHLEVAAAAGGTVAGSTNIAAAANGGRIVAVSSQAKDENGQIYPQWQVSNVIDGLYVVGSHTPPNSYGWSSDAPPSVERPQWLIIAFGPEGKERTHLISRVVVDPTTDDPPVIGRWVKNMEILVSVTDKNGPYKSVGKFLVVNKPMRQTFDFAPVECRFLKIIITENHGSDRCVELGEIEVYEALVGDEQLDQLIIRLENILLELKRYRDAQRYQEDRKSREEATRKPVGVVGSSLEEKAPGAP